jgi:hypothetical protein
MDNDELRHWGILGMKWGLRRFQNEDGSLTPEGRERYGKKQLSISEMREKSKEYEAKANYYRNLNAYMDEEKKYKARFEKSENNELGTFLKKNVVKPIGAGAAKFISESAYKFLNEQFNSNDKNTPISKQNAASYTKKHKGKH